MKYIIIGLGSFGASLAEKLTAQGHEVIGVDVQMGKVEAVKEKLSHAVALDATDESAVMGLPLRDTDVVIVAIGENQGANIMATALFKNHRVKRLLSRAINSLHEKVLEAIGVDEIVHPEEEAAGRWAKKLCLRNVIDSYEIGEHHSLVEAEVPPQYVGQNVLSVGFREKFNLLVLTTIKRETVPSAVGETRRVSRVQGVAAPNTELEADDILVLYGANEDLSRFLARRVS